MRQYQGVSWNWTRKLDNWQQRKHHGCVHVALAWWSISWCVILYDWPLPYVVGYYKYNLWLTRECQGVSWICARRLGNWQECKRNGCVPSMMVYPMVHIYDWPLPNMACDQLANFSLQTTMYHIWFVVHIVNGWIQKWLLNYAWPTRWMLSALLWQHLFVLALERCMYQY